MKKLKKGEAKLKPKHKEQEMKRGGRGPGAQTHHHSDFIHTLKQSLPSRKISFLKALIKKKKKSRD